MIALVCIVKLLYKSTDVSLRVFYQAIKNQNRLNLMNNATEKPEPPAPNECCENGCDPCVWDIYREALSDWHARQTKTSQKPPATTDDET